MCVVHLLQISYYNPTKHIPHEGTIIICLNVAVQLRIINSRFRKIIILRQVRVPFTALQYMYKMQSFTSTVLFS